MWLAVFTPLVLTGVVLYVFGAAVPAILNFPINEILALLAGAAAAYLTHRTVKNSAARAGASIRRKGYVAVLLVVGLIVMRTISQFVVFLNGVMSLGAATPVSELIWLTVLVASCALGVLAARQFLTPSEVEGNQNVEV